MEKKALIFSIQRYSLHDGPGIRTLVFFTGCPLRCIWCSNPEGIHPFRQVIYVKSQCRGCRACLECPHEAVTADAGKGFCINAEKCLRCGLCVERCPTKAKSWCSTELTLDELFATVVRDAVFYTASGGGVTLGGGDPLQQHHFAAAFLQRCRGSGINTAIETEAQCSFEALSRCAVHCDTIHIDIKAWEPRTHKAVTGVSNDVILANILALDQWISTQTSKPAFIIRIPMLPEINFKQRDMNGVARFLLSLDNLSLVEMLPFHNLGEHKYEQIGSPYTLEGHGNLNSTDVADYAQILTDYGLRVKITDW